MSGLWWEWNSGEKARRLNACRGVPDEEWTVQFSEIQKCSPVGNTNLYKGNQCKEKLNTKTPPPYFLILIDCLSLLSQRSSGHLLQQVTWLRHPSDKGVIKHISRALSSSSSLYLNVWLDSYSLEIPLSPPIETLTLLDPSTV